MIDSSGTSLKWSDSKFFFVLYAALSAGIFEELGRYFGFKWMLKKHREYKDGVSYGLGHGGIEAILIGMFSAINALVLGTLINSGVFDQTIAKSLPADQVAMLKERIIGTQFWEYVLGGLERVFAIAFHIALSLLVLLGIRENRFIFVINAVLLHALIDVIPALYQTGVVTNIWIVELVLAIFGITSIIFTMRIRKRYQSKDSFLFKVGVSFKKGK